jgi:hypothetical protein
MSCSGSMVASGALSSLSQVKLSGLTCVSVLVFWVPSSCGMMGSIFVIGAGVLLAGSACARLFGNGPPMSAAQWWRVLCNRENRVGQQKAAAVIRTRSLIKIIGFRVKTWAAEVSKRVEACKRGQDVARHHADSCTIFDNADNQCQNLHMLAE